MDTKPTKESVDEREDVQHICDVLRQALEVIAVGDSENPAEDARKALVEAGIWMSH